MPNSAQNIKFYYGDSSSVYPPQSIDTNGLYLIKNKGVYAGSETIIDTSLFPFNNENTFIAHLYIDNDQTAPTSGTTKIYEDPSALIDAVDNNKTIIGVLDRTTLSRHRNYMDGNYTDPDTQISFLLRADNIKPDGILLAKYTKSEQAVTQGSGEIGSYIFTFYDNYSTHVIQYRKNSSGVITQLIGISKFGETWAEGDHDHPYNSVLLSGNAADTDTAVVRQSANTQNKTVSITNWIYKHGNILQVRFKNGNTAANPTLNVNSGGAYNIMYGKTALTDTTLIKPDDCVTFIYYELETIKYWYILSIDHAAERVKSVNDDASVAYLTGTTVGGINSLVYDSSVYLTTTPGELRATSFNENGVPLADKYALAGHTHSTITASTQYSGTYYLLGTTGNANLQPKYSPNVYISAGGTLRATTFNEGGTTLANKYAPLLKYTVKAASGGSATFTTSSKMQPNTVYVIGSGSNPFSFTTISSVVLASGSTSLLADDIGMIWSTGQASITDNMTVPMYQMVFKASGTGVSFSMPSSIKWKDGSAPDARATSNKMCELTIINNIATINII